MEKELDRQQRVAQEIKKEIAIIVHREINDPRIDMMITISSVEVSRDLSHAKVFVSFLNYKNRESVKTNIKVLQDASSFIRYILGKTMRLRNVPEITFFYDNSLIESIRISNLVTNVIKYDKERRMHSYSNKENYESF